MNYGKIVHRTIDDSYVIIKNGMPYHVPNFGEFKEEWDKVKTYALENPKLVTEEQPLIPSHDTIQDIKYLKLNEINTSADAAISELIKMYPDREIATFDKQEAEARAYLADTSAPTPFLLIIAKTRGIELSDLVNRVIAKADKFADLSARIIGQRQALEDRVNACRTIAEIEAIQVNIALG